MIQDSWRANKFEDKASPIFLSLIESNLYPILHSLIIKYSFYPILALLEKYFRLLSFNFSLFFQFISTLNTRVNADLMNRRGYKAGKIAGNRSAVIKEVKMKNIYKSHFPGQDVLWHYWLMFLNSRY